MLQKIFNKIFGDPNEKELKRLAPLVGKINDIEKKYQETLKDEYIPAKTAEFKERLAKGETLDDLLPEVFALVKNACRRLVGKKWLVRNKETEWNMIPFDVQLIGGMVLHGGKIAEMKTGEGKTLVASLPLYLNALAGKGAFLVTVNDYLAQRDAEWMGGLYKFLGLTIGVIKHGQSHEEKREAYACDITYGTNNEFGFDYLRDNMSTDMEHIVQRELNYAIVDEVDSILIDEARTPLIISAPAEESTEKYHRYARLIPQLKDNDDYVVDEKMRTATLTEAGIAKMEKALGMENIYADGGFEEVHHIEQSLKAHALFKLDTDYVVKDNQVIIVDEFTGRMMPGRRYSDGLHQAIEAKENVEVRRESRTLATVSFQNYFRLFKKLAGMTGTALTEAEEFSKIYNLDTIVIPTNQPMVRNDMPDAVYKNQKGKYMAAISKIKELHKKGQPVLIGTVSIDKSEILSRLLTAHGITHTVLNAKFHEKEAEIVAQAGQKGAVTIATNMAGRGTDIKLGEEVVGLGGLFILGTERHESRRIDNQLRGRSGRQGDPGATQFLVSMDDDLMRLFGAERVQKMMEFMRVPDDMPIENKMISNSIESAQKKVEARHFEVRKHLVEYDDVMNKQREIIYSRRRKMLFSKEVKNDILALIEGEAEAFVLNHTGSRREEDWDLVKIKDAVGALHKDPKNPLEFKKLEESRDPEAMIDLIKHYLWNEYLEREKMLPDYDDSKGSPMLRDLERALYLRTLDMLWMEHIDNMTHLREAVSLRGYSQKDPLIEYKQDAFRMFSELLANIRSNTVNTLFKVEFRRESPAPMIRERMPSHIQTNQDQIDSVLSGHGDNPAILKVGAGAGNRGSQPQPAVKTTGRNELCPCGSKKKYKKCHGK